MIRQFFILFSFSILLAACSKSSDSNKCSYSESTLVAPAAEIAILQAFVTANRPTAVQHPSGFFYDIISAGTGTVTPTVCSNVTVRYTGYLLNATKFDESLGGTTFPLGQLIVGWQKGLPLIKKGGTIFLYIPPSLGYGNVAVGSIPANSYLIFSIELFDVQ